VSRCEVGQLDLAYDYFAEAALMDLTDLEHNTRDGIHTASLTGTWIAAVAGFGGMRDHDGHLSFAPRPPGALTRLTFRLCFQGRRLLVATEPQRVIYSLIDGPPLEITHHAENVTLTRENPVILPIPALSPPEPATQPPGRAPVRHGRSRSQLVVQDPRDRSPEQTVVDPARVHSQLGAHDLD
jgi:alpha,alpha-trehalose phosphorylase